MPLEEADDSLAAAIEEQLDANAALPAAYAIVDGTEVTFGNRQGAGPDTPFVVGSVSKTFTALAALVAVNRGELSLDAPVTDYLPDFSLAASAGDEPIRIRHLLNHSSGISGIGCNLNRSAPANTLEERVEQLRTVTPQSAPGERFAYCNVGFAVVAHVLEQSSGRPFAEVLQRTVLTPLGMERTYTDLATARENGLAEGHTTILGLPVARPEGGVKASLADGYVISTARDLARFAQFQMGDGQTHDGTRMLSRELLLEMHRASIALPDLEGTELESYALGWFTGDVGGTRIVTHSGTTPRYHASVALVPSERRAVITLVAGQWLSGAGSTSAGAIGELAGLDVGVNQLYLIVTAVLWLGASLLVLTVTVSMLPSRRRGRRLKRPRALTGPLLVLVSAGMLAVLVGPAIPETGSLPAAIQFGWENTPDLLVLALAWPLVIAALGARSIVERSRWRATSAALSA